MRRRPHGASFTLIEVTLGLAILVLIFGVIFQLVQMSVLGADAAAKNSLRNREITGLFALVRHLCLDLPVRSRLSLEPRSTGKGFDLRLENAPLAIFPAKQDGTAVLRFSLQKDPVGRGQKLWLEEISQPTGEINRTRAPETNAFELMREITDLRWSAFDPRDGQEKTEWNDPVKPAYLKLELTRREGAEERTYMGIFWIPAGYSPSGQPPVDPVTRNLVAANVGPGVTPTGGTAGGTFPSPGTPGGGVGQGGAGGGPSVGGLPGGGNRGPAIRYTPIQR